MRRGAGAGLALALALGVAWPAPAAALTPQELTARLAPEAGWASHVAAARAAEATADAELIPAAFAGFVAAKRGTLREDPDIHERLLYFLESFPAAAVADRLKAAPLPPELRHGTDTATFHRWLDAIAADPRGFGALRVVQGDGLNAFLGGGDPVPPPPSAVAVPGGDADVSAPPTADPTIPPSRLPPHLASRLAWVPGGLLLVLLGLVALAGLRPRTRPAVFRVVALGFAPAALIFLETALTVAGMEPLSAVRPNFNLGSDRSGLDWFDARGDLLEMAKNNARHQVFAARKPEGTVRIVALGGSSVRGKGDLVEYAWPSVLQRRLQACAPPGTRVEVINAGADGALSDDLAVVARDLASAQPDVFVVYTGYNDFVFVPLLTRFEGFSPARMGLRHLLGRTRTAHLLVRWTGRLPREADRERAPDAPAAPSDGQVAEMRGLLAANLDQNLQRVAAVAQGAGARAVFVTQGQNETLCGPGSLNGQAPWDRACFPVEARRTILQAASASGVTVVDAAAALRADADGATVGWSHFWDEIHPGRRGSAVIGEAVADSLRRSLWPAATPDARCAGPLPARPER